MNRDILTLLDQTIKLEEKFLPKFAAGTSQHSLLKNRIQSLHTARKQISGESVPTKEELEFALPRIESIIHKMSNGYKNIRKSYTQYIDNADVSWTVDVDLAKLEAIIAKQDSYIALLNRDDVKQINKSAGTDGIQL